MHDTWDNAQYERRLRLAELVSDLSARFVNLPSGDVDAEIESKLQRVVEFLKADAAGMDLLGPEGGLFRPFSYVAPGVDVELSADDLEVRFPWYAAKVRAGETIILSRIPEGFPEEAAAEREYCGSAGIRAAIVLPVGAGSVVLGALFFLSKRGPRPWPDGLVQRLKLIGELFANALLRKRTEEALRESEERFRALVHQVPVGIFLSDFGTGTLFRNEKLCEITGLSPKEPSQWDWTTILHPEDRERFVGAWQRFMCHDEPFDCEYRYVTNSGKTVWVSTRATHFRGPDGNVKGTLGAVVDITERREAETSLREALSEISRLKEQLEAENMYLRKEIQMKQNVGRIVGQSAGLKHVLLQIEQVAPTDSTVLILGETGTGKGLLARAIHDLSPRKDRPFVMVNCAALPANLIESELFGREKGAFTGSHARQIGRFELANNGTILLDEIGELPLELQAKLLMVLQEGQFERLGSPRTIRVNTRVIASTSRDLKEEISNGRFRQDLYYRLNVFPVTIPPLRERTEDIAPLVDHFVRVYAKKMDKNIRTVEKETLKALEAYAWPGNVRELEHVIERAVITCSGPVLGCVESINALETRGNKGALVETVAEAERAHILRVLEKTSWRIEGGDGAAHILGLAPSTLRSRMQRLKIKRPARGNLRS